MRYGGYTLQITLKTIAQAGEVVRKLLQAKLEYELTNNMVHLEGLNKDELIAGIAAAGSYVPLEQINFFTAEEWSSSEDD